MFPNIHTLLCIIYTLPVTTCPCERRFSVLRRLKTYLQSTMGAESMTGLAFMHIHYGMELNLEKSLQHRIHVECSYQKKKLYNCIIFLSLLQLHQKWNTPYEILDTALTTYYIKVMVSHGIT